MPSPDLVITQPLLAPYRVPVLRHLARVAGWRITLVADRAATEAGFGEIDFQDAGVAAAVHGEIVPLFGGHLIWQRGVLPMAFMRRRAVYWLCANPRDLAFWMALAVLAMRGRRVYAHGQGAYARPHGGAGYALAWRLLVRLSTAYIAYTPLSAASLSKLGVDARKLRVAHNTLELSAVIPAQERHLSGQGVLFIGRLRTGCELELLIDAIALLRARLGSDVTLDVVGDGVEGAALRRHRPSVDWIRWHGALYDETQIVAIARRCVVGCYPGNAGLSVLQYMGLSLVPVVHDAIQEHMGPEPGYVENGRNGLTFHRGLGAEGLADTLALALSNPEAAKALAAAAWQTYEQLSRPSLGERLASIFAEGMMDSR